MQGLCVPGGGAGANHTAWRRPGSLSFPWILFIWISFYTSSYHVGFLWNDRVNLCWLSGCLKGELVLTITPDGTLNSCLTFKFLFMQIPYYQVITSHVRCSALEILLLVCANLHYRWVPAGGGANQNAKRCPDFCPVAQHCCFWHTTWFCLYVLIQKLCCVCTVKITFR